MERPQLKVKSKTTITFLYFLLLPFYLVLMSNSVVGITLSALSHGVGAFAARWLFFAEAEHVVGLYYGAR